MKPSICCLPLFTNNISGLPSLKSNISLLSCLLQLRDVALANIGSVHKSSDLRRRLSALSLEDLRDVVCSKVLYLEGLLL